MLITDTSTLDLSKYDRFIAIGCSFTNYRWYTWADIISLEMPNAEYINLGKSGAGNQYIFTQLNQAIVSLNLTERDFVAIMWSGFYRDDKYITGYHANWCTPGNLFTQDEYPQEYIDRFVDLRGYAVRDLALIDTATRVLETQPFDSIQMMGIPYQLQAYHSGIANDLEMEDLFSAYSRLDNFLLPDLSYYINPEKWVNEYKYLDGNGNMYEDYHPSAIKYAGYVEHLGIKLSAETMEKVQSEHNRMKAVKHSDELNHEGPTRILF